VRWRKGKRIGKSFNVVISQLRGFRISRHSPACGTGLWNLFALTGSAPRYSYQHGTQIRARQRPAAVTIVNPCTKFRGVSERLAQLHLEWLRGEYLIYRASVASGCVNRERLRIGPGAKRKRATHSRTVLYYHAANLKRHDGKANTVAGQYRRARALGVGHYGQGERYPSTLCIEKLTCEPAADAEPLDPTPPRRSLKHAASTDTRPPVADSSVCVGQSPEVMETEVNEPACRRVEAARIRRVRMAGDLRRCGRDPVEEFAVNHILRIWFGTTLVPITTNESLEKH